MRVIFMGTPAFAVSSLEALLHSGHSVVGVWTRPDKPRGRGHHVEASPVKLAAIRGGAPVYQPSTLRRPEAADEVAALAPDVICVAAYGLILPQVVLQAPRLGCVNVHASLLPRYRGAAPIHRAVMAGETLTGITTMMMDAGLDTGDILLSDEEPIGPDDTTGEVERRLAERGARLLLETVRRLEQGSCPRIPQDNAQATYAPPVTREECRIDWTRDAGAIHNLVRGANPRPGAFTTRAGDLLRILRTAVVQEPPSGAPGVLGIRAGRKNPVMRCGDGALELITVQPAGKAPMSGADYLRGRPARPGQPGDEVWK